MSNIVHETIFNKAALLARVAELVEQDRQFSVCPRPESAPPGSDSPFVGAPNTWNVSWIDPNAPSAPPKRTAA